MGSDPVARSSTTHGEKREMLKVHCRCHLHGSCHQGKKEKELLRIEKEIAIPMKQDAEGEAGGAEEEQEDPNIMYLEKPETGTGQEDAAIFEQWQLPSEAYT